MLFLARVLTLRLHVGQNACGGSPLWTVVASRLPVISSSGENLVEGILFTLLPSPQSRWKSFATGWSVQALSLLCLLFVGVRFHQNPIRLDSYRVTRLVSYEPLVAAESQPVKAPALARPKPPVDRKPALESKPVLESKTSLPTLVVTPQVRRVVQHTSTSEPEPAAPALKLESKMPVMPPAATSQVVAVGTFSHDSPVTAPVAKLASSVQSGSFGDGASGASGHGRGMGAGNSNVVMSSGFGNGAIEAFSSASLRPKTGSHQSGNGGANAPVEITFKPKPNYTDEGRKQKINGEVRLEVLFKSDGRVHVVKVLQGLGYGLDEQAVKAAEQIKFTPALHEGQAVDSTALVRIIFELIS
jgi:TonB family protein